MSIAVIGAGKWGQALQFALSRNFTCKITSRQQKSIENFVNLEEALTCQYLIFALPAQVVRGWLETHFSFSGQKILVAAKGIEQGSGAFLNEIFANFVPEDHLSFLSGPSFASEVIQGLPTALVINSTNDILAKEFASFFPSFIKTYTSKDVIGAEVCGAYKNVLAIASGICDGLRLGNNARASLIARGLVEMRRFGKYFGAQDETFLGLSGAGDLFLTASSTLSRNYRVGLFLAEGKKLEDILIALGEVAEGVFTSAAIFELSLKHTIYTPIAHEIALILKGKEPRISVKDLLAD
ncbi:NAD(P)H-dependent glycerol-3-phosphate dehydrogenase [Sulfurospirillum diekertiae]|uniref:Glycerol-3-phosphate dehydrogenase [NAD(P)+] n=1 Tax=Sulfurospirillum diekertiae TaxID=1854492 RepID=A0A1Y0HKH1_9BACT|nr:NAD(P)H-dependent glycerol-3-phosphate dehydrogenase [Sulfurospirillum diekertiae]ARU48611.1 Glycerol-3-phosphate dehydrogenase [NAD(P)+] [Sulfurospirillum diekertiae]ASC93441.1 Glycerol-3-phosphate dehydrogenase [NAD(P)+] [Sulfurospirillum diekertiae]